MSNLHRKPLVAATLLASLLLCACASVEFTRDSQTSGHFVSKARSVTILAWDLPKDAIDIARENVSDAQRPNVQITEVEVKPDWGRLNWLLDIASVRKATLRGTWGFRGKD